MEEKQKPKNNGINIPYVSGVAQPMSNLESANAQLTSTNVKPTKSARISAHSLKWTWDYKGKTERKPDKLRRMRGWTGKIYYWNRCTIILNVRTMELYTRSRPYKDTRRMVYCAWAKADLIAREFSKAAQIAIKPIHTEHPADLRQAHLVINNKRINKALLPGKADSEERRQFIGKNEPYQSAVRVGAIEDGSHPGRVELVGQESAEGGFGMDWLLLEHPKAHKTLDQRLEAVVIALEKLTDGMEQIKIRMDMEAKK